MHSSDWADWARTELRCGEAEILCAALTPEQRDALGTQGHVWAREMGVLWKDPKGRLHRARYTHGIHFATTRGEFYIDSEGTALARPSRPGLRAQHGDPVQAE